MQGRDFTITVSDDEMEAWIRFHTDAPIPLDQLTQSLKRSGVVCGIDHFFLQDLADAHHPAHPYRIAQGLPAEEGLEFFFSRAHDHTPKRLPDGRVDFYNLDTIQNVVQQQILVARIPPADSKPGKTVTGRDIPPTGQPVPLPQAGMNVELSEDGQTLIAQINGHPVLSENVLSVESTYTLDGDVDFSVGNVTCISALVIAGDVKSGFSVKGAHDVSVHGAVDGGDIDAQGSVYLYGNVFGKHKSHIRSTQHIRGAYVDAARLEARKDIVLTRGAHHSDLKAGASILVQGAQGHIVGGSAEAYGRIVSHDLGSVTGIETRIDIRPGVFDESTYNWFLSNLAAMFEEDDMLLAEPGEVALPPHGIAVMKEALQRGHGAIRNLSDYLKVRQQMFSGLPRQCGTIVATGTVYPGVTVEIAGASLVITHPLTSVMFYKAGGAVLVKVLDEVCTDLS